MLLYILLASLFFSLTSAALPFQDKSFSISSKLTHIHYHAKPTSVDVQEIYSFEQNRAKITFDKETDTTDLGSDAQPLSGRFTLDSSRKVAVLLQSKTFRCRTSTTEELTQILGLVLPSQDFEAPEYVVGPARLLFFLEKNKAFMKEVASDSQVRNMPTRMRFLDYSEKGVKFYVFYRQVGGDILQNSIPIRVTIIYENYATRVDYSQFELGRSYQDESLISEGVLLDPFSFELSLGCSKDLANFEEDIFVTRPVDTTRFSFNAEVIYKMPSITGKSVVNGNSVKISHFVAYDAWINAMRLDIIRTARHTGVKQQLFNLQTNRMYHIIEQLVRGKTAVDNILDISKKRANTELDSKTETTQCMVARIHPDPVANSNKEPGRKFTISELLVGNSKFIYMGLGFVKGERVKIYEASDVKFPFWLEQTVEYKSTAGRSETREPHKGVGFYPDPFKYDAVVYMKDTGEKVPTIGLIEIFKMSAQNLVSYSKHTIHMHDFTWDLSNKSPLGDPTSELFSLADLCSAGPSYNSYSRIEMLLDAGEVDLSEENDLKDGTSRDLVIQGGLQDSMGLPVTMIHDLESRYIRQNQHLSKNTHAISTSFRVAKRSNNLVELIYLDNGQPVKKALTYTLNGWRRSFQACFFMAAHARANLYFAYNRLTNECFIDLIPVRKDSGDKMTSVHFELTPHGQFEVYRTNHVKDEQSDPSWLRDYFRSQNKPLGNKITLKGVSNDNSDITFTIKRIVVHERDQKAPKGDKNKEDMALDMIEGFGLDESIQGNKLVMPAPLNSYNWAPIDSNLADKGALMSMEICQASCISDLSCQSFSVCLRNAQVECINSQFSFKSPDVIRKLKALKEDQNKIDVEINSTTTVTLTRHSNCALYNKIHLDLFKKPVRINHSILNRRIYPVYNADSCAEKCFLGNLKVLRNDLMQISESESKYGYNLDVDDETLSQLWDKHKRIGRQMCRAFLYLDLISLSTLSENARSIIKSRLSNVDTKEPNQVGGYCVIGERRSESEIQEMTQDGQDYSQVEDKYTLIDFYVFKFGVFFEKQYGIQIKASPMNSNEYIAYKSLVDSPKESRAVEFGLMRAMVERGDNIQEPIYGDESKCALVCFLQSWGPWPACKSFDIVIERRGGEAISRCYLNSITLKRAIVSKRLDLINDQIGDTQTWHYEPRAGFATADSAWEESLELARENSMLHTKWLGNLVIHSFGIVIVALVGILSGFLLGIYGSRRYLKRVEDQLETQIIVNRPTVEFSNLVDYEGTIRDGE